MQLHGKTRAELATALRVKSRDELLELIYRLTTFEHLLGPREIAEATGCDKRAVIRDMQAGRFADPIYGPGFFYRGSTSMKVSSAAANAWRASFFVPVPLIPADKKNAGQREIGFAAKKAQQRLIRRLIEQKRDILGAAAGDGGFH